jgi:spore maturation protein CgeB
MPRTWNKKVLAVLMQWEYCDRSRGVSGDKLIFFDVISKLAPGAEAFWYDDYIHDLPELRRKLLEKAEAVKPDLIYWMSFTDQLDPATLDKLKAICPTSAWFGDDTWRFDSYSSKLAPHFTYPLTTDMFSVEKYRKLGVEPILTQWAGHKFGPDQIPKPAGSKFKYEVSFVGGYNYVRGWFIKTLAKKGIDVECFGHGWPNGLVSFEEMENIFNNSRISLNLSNSVPHDIRCVLASPLNLAYYLRGKKNSEQIKARNFEIPLAGGFQLTNYAPGLERYLEIGKEVTVFTTPEDCSDQIRYYLANDAERTVIAAAGHARAVKEHTYLARMEAVFSKIWP